MRRDYKSIIREIPDFPKPGINFKDVTPLLTDKDVFHDLIDDLSDEVNDWDFSKIAVIESRGFLFGAALAYKLHKGIIITRKKGKLPHRVLRAEYELEYGTDCVEIHTDSLEKGERVLIFDDLIATGGTAEATGRLVEQCGGEVAGYLFIIDLAFLNGVEKIKRYPVRTLVAFNA